MRGPTYFPGFSPLRDIGHDVRSCPCSDCEYLRVRAGMRALSDAEARKARAPEHYQQRVREYTERSGVGVHDSAEHARLMLESALAVAAQHGVDPAEVALLAEYTYGPGRQKQVHVLSLDPHDPARYALESDLLLSTVALMTAEGHELWEGAQGALARRWKALDSVQADLALRPPRAARVRGKSLRRRRHPAYGLRMLPLLLGTKVWKVSDREVRAYARETVAQGREPAWVPVPVAAAVSPLSLEAVEARSGVMTRWAVAGIVLGLISLSSSKVGIPQPYPLLFSLCGFTLATTALRAAKLTPLTARTLTLNAACIGAALLTTCLLVGAALGKPLLPLELSLGGIGALLSVAYATGLRGQDHLPIRWPVSWNTSYRAINTLLCVIFGTIAATGLALLVSALVQGYTILTAPIGIVFLLSFAAACFLWNARE